MILQEMGDLEGAKAAYARAVALLDPATAAVEAEVSALLAGLPEPDWRRVLKLAALMDEAKEDALAFMAFPKSTAPRSAARTPWSGSTARSSAAPTSSASSPNEVAVVRLVGAIPWSRTASGPSSAAT